MKLGSAMTLVSQAGSNLWRLTPGGLSLTVKYSKTLGNKFPPDNCHNKA